MPSNGLGSNPQQPLKKQTGETQKRWRGTQPVEMEKLVCGTQPAERSTTSTESVKQRN